MFAKRSSAGFVSIQVLSSGIIALTSLLLLMNGLTSLTRSSQTQRVKADLEGEIEKRLALASSKISALGMPNFLQSYATSRGVIGQINPLLDSNPNSSTVFNLAFSGLNPTESVSLSGRTFQFNSEIQVYDAAYDAVGNEFKATPIALPSNSATVSDVKFLKFVITATEEGQGTISTRKELVYGYTF